MLNLKPIIDAIKDEHLVFNVTRGSTPTVIQPSKTKAKKEAERLAKLQIGDKFIVCQVITVHHHIQPQYEINVRINDEELRKFPVPLVKQLSQELQAKWRQLNIDY